MLRQDWPESRRLRSLDLVELRAAVATGDINRFSAAVDGVDLDDALHQVAAGIPMLLEHRGDRAETFSVSVINRRTRRNWDGDDVLAPDLIALLRHDTRRPRCARRFADALRREKPDRWLRTEPVGPRDGWYDMAAFIARLPDTSLAVQLQQAIEGRGVSSVPRPHRRRGTHYRLAHLLHGPSARPRPCMARRPRRPRQSHRQDPDGPGAT